MLDLSIARDTAFHASTHVYVASPSYRTAASVVGGAILACSTCNLTDPLIYLQLRHHACDSQVLLDLIGHKRCFRSALFHRTVHTPSMETVEAVLRSEEVFKYTFAQLKCCS